MSRKNTLENKGKRREERETKDNSRKKRSLGIKMVELTNSEKEENDDSDPILH